MGDFETCCFCYSGGEPMSSVLLGNHEYLLGTKKKKRKIICWAVHKDLFSLLVGCIF